ncbi:clostripain-related cysteine peptidase [Bdellovibrio svalbardensis]|uniref:Clostripain-related cysteine peptidase n=1 Tax=Bdellovibrio svalbardensis TaxID=2972972 RepID=A0ABT6DJV2_9BACT|nr:clostripain-related cysteine peptidase [Bdellovibrio svalbardensis]MDG0816804.1 clostripain-related cysteine peptidase [Bdellovibrio svalbardensis]
MNQLLSHVFVCLLLLLSTSYSHAAEPVKEWNFLVFINGVNNLDSYGPLNINQMEEVGSSEKMNILVQWGSYTNPNVTRLLVKKDNDKANVTSPIVQNLGGADMGDWKELVRFVEWSQQNYPAKHYFIVVWDHGSGWHIVKANNKGAHIQDISQDDRTGNFITTEQLALAMNESAKIIGHKVDIYASDACSMGMVEIASEMQEDVQYYIGSQDIEPGEGWPYSTFLTKWSSQVESLSAKQVAVLLSKEFMAAYDGGIYGKKPVTMSVYDLSQISNYEQAFKQVGQDLSRLSPADLVKANKAASDTKYFSVWDYRDSLDFLFQLEKNGITAASFAKLRAAQNNFVITNDQTQDNNTWGVSVWLPVDNDDYSEHAQRYEGLKFQKNSGWGVFLKRMILK